MAEYFEGLNYALANEDTNIEFNLLDNNVDSIFSVCGSGSRVLPLIAKNPKEIHIVDLSEVQLALFRLRYQAAKKLSYPEFLYFLGYTKNLNVKRSDLIARLGLSPQDLALWKSQEIKWENMGFIYLGRWENHFMKLGSIYQAATFTSLRSVFASNNFEEQQQELRKHFNPKLFNLFTKILLNEFVFNKFLYKGHFAGGKDKKTVKKTAAQLVYHEFCDLFSHTWVKSNFFLNMVFLGELIHPESFPLECREDVFAAVKNSQTSIHLHQGNLLDIVHQKPHSFYSLSDTFSYMSDEDVTQFFDKFSSDVPVGAKIVIRTFMRKPQLMTSGPWANLLDLNEKLAIEDCTRMYEFSVIEKRN